MADEIVVHGPDGAEASVPAGTTARSALEALGALRGQVVVARVDQDLRDLSAQVADGSTVQPVAADSPDGRSVIRHSVAHVMAQAVTDLFPDAKFAIGPAIADGFYYDFDVERAFTPEDLERITERMEEIVREDQAFQRRELGREEALDLFGDQPYKVEIIEAATATDDPEAAAEAGRIDLAGPVSRSAPAEHPMGPRVRPRADGGGVLAGRRAQRPAPAHLRHRLGVAQGAEGVPAASRGGPQARPPQAAARPRPRLDP